MEFRRKLSEVDDLLYRLGETTAEPLRTYEVHPTTESLGWGRNMVCEYDYTVRVPALKLFFRDSIEYEFDKAEQEEICQCEYGQIRSVGCAAAIQEHFYRRGIDIFAEYTYYSNQVVYHTVFETHKHSVLT